MDRLRKMGKNFGGNFGVIFVVSAYTPFPQISKLGGRFEFRLYAELSRASQPAPTEFVTTPRPADPKAATRDSETGTYSKMKNEYGDMT